MRSVALLSCLVAVALGCSNQNLAGSSGSFSSPNYPSNYDSNLNCDWTITVPSGSVSISFSDFDVEGYSSLCSYDKVVIREGSSQGEILGTFCGTSAGSVQTRGRVAYVQFTTDVSIVYRGFSAQWSSSGSGGGGGIPTTVSPPASTCGGEHSGETGTITSPNYPNNYPSSSMCEYTVSIPEGVIQLKFDTVNVESSSGCSYDSIKVYDGASLKATICGTSPTTVEGTSNSLRVVFTSDSSVQQTGWSASWSRLTCESKGLTCVAPGSCKGTVKDGYYCENSGACCDPPFEQGDCGVIPPARALIGGKPRIVGGNEAARHSWPWQVSLRTTSSSFHFCGGSIISPQWIVTAAHCVDGDTPSGLKITSGEHDKSSGSGRETDHSVEKIIMHEAYDGNGAGFPNDIALVKLQTPMTMDNYRRPICLADDDENFNGDFNCFITGWGNTQGTGNEDVLNELSVSVWQQATCQNTWGSSYVNAGHICVGTGDTGACNGDSGGPLACQKSRGGEMRWVLAGATSWGRSGCQTAGYPSVYSRVSYFRSWLISTMRAN